MRKAICIAVLVGAMAVPATASTKKVAVGDYESAPTISSGKSYSVGVFTVVKDGGKRQIVRGEQYNGIFYPDAHECDSYDLPLAAESIPISSTGRFRIKEKTPVEDSFVSVNWKGHWSKPGVVAGSITIKFDGCTSKHKWTGGKVG
jgi:hypothetical protein